jgi:hypothetical protein
MIANSKVLKVGKVFQKSARAFSTGYNVVQVDFKEIQNQDKSLFAKFEEAYGDNGVGAMVVNNIPSFPEKRKQLLPYAQRLASLDRKTLETMETPEYFYSVGWSHGREKFRGKPDMLKGSYYGCPLVDRFKMILADGEETYFENKWPKPGVIDGFEESFKDLGKFINSVGIEVGKNLDKYIKAR